MLNSFKKQWREITKTIFLLSLLAAASMSKDRAIGVVDRLRYVSAKKVLPARISQQSKTKTKKAYETITSAQLEQVLARTAPYSATFIKNSVEREKAGKLIFQELKKMSVRAEESVNFSSDIENKTIFDVISDASNLGILSCDNMGREASPLPLVDKELKKRREEINIPCIYDIQQIEWSEHRCIMFKLGRELAELSSVTASRYELEELANDLFTLGIIDEDGKFVTAKIKVSDLVPQDRAQRDALKSLFERYKKKEANNEYSKLEEQLNQEFSKSKARVADFDRKVEEGMSNKEYWQAITKKVREDDAQLIRVVNLGVSVPTVRRLVHGLYGEDEMAVVDNLRNHQQNFIENKDVSYYDLTRDLQALGFFPGNRPLSSSSS